MDVNFCKEALEEAIDIYGKPQIFNTDQGSQFTSTTFTDVLKSNDIRISMDGKRRWFDNVFIERFWRSIKYESIYIQEFDNISQLSRTIDDWVDFYNKERPHFAFAGQSPDMIYNPGELRISSSFQTAVLARFLYPFLSLTLLQFCAIFWTTSECIKEDIRYKAAEGIIDRYIETEVEWEQSF